MMYTIKKATPENLEDILDILESVLLDNLPSLDNGFLSTKPWKDFYKDIMKKTKFFYVAQDQNDTVGFLIAYPNNMLDTTNDIQKKIIDTYPQENFIYIFQIAVSPTHQWKGIGRLLYEELFKDTQDIKKIVITSAIPYNKASEQFHTKLWFQKIGTIERKDGGSNFIYENTWIKN